MGAYRGMILHSMLCSSQGLSSLVGDRHHWLPPPRKKNYSGLVSLVLATPLTIVLPLQRLVGYNNALDDRGRLPIRGSHLLLCYARDHCSESCYFMHDNCRRGEPSSWVPNIESVHPEKNGSGKYPSLPVYVIFTYPSPSVVLGVISPSAFHMTTESFLFYEICYSPSIRVAGPCSLLCCYPLGFLLFTKFAGLPA